MTKGTDPPNVTVSKKKRRKKGSGRKKQCFVEVDKRTRSLINKNAREEGKTVKSYLHNLVRNNKKTETENERLREKQKLLRKEINNLKKDIINLGRSLDKSNINVNELKTTIFNLEQRCSTLETLNAQFELNNKAFINKNLFNNNDPKTIKITKHLLGLKWNQVIEQFNQFKHKFRVRKLNTSGQHIVNGLPPLKKQKFLSDDQLLQYFLMTLTWLRRGFTVMTLSILFGISISSVSSIRRNIIRIWNNNININVFNRVDYLNNMNMNTLRHFGGSIVFLIDCNSLFPFTF